MVYIYKRANYGKQQNSASCFFSQGTRGKWWKMYLLPTHYLSIFPTYSGLLGFIPHAIISSRAWLVEHHVFITFQENLAIDLVVNSFKNHLFESYSSPKGHTSEQICPCELFNFSNCTPHHNQKNKHIFNLFHHMICHVFHNSPWCSIIFPLCTLWLFHITMAKWPTYRWSTWWFNIWFYLLKIEFFIDFSIFSNSPGSTTRGYFPNWKNHQVHRQGRRRCIEDVVAARRCHRSVGPDAGGPTTPPAAVVDRRSEESLEMARLMGPHLAGGWFWLGVKNMLDGWHLWK